MLPYSGTYAALGNNITDAMKLAANEHGGKLGGREIDWVAVDDESDPAKAPANVNKLIAGEKVDILTGPVIINKDNADKWAKLVRGVFGDAEYKKQTGW